MDFDCKELPSVIKDATVKDKDSSSPTDVIFAKLRDGNIPVSIKAFLDTSTLPTRLLNAINDKHQDVLGVKYEMRVYEEIIHRITMSEYSPNFVPYVGKVNCTLEEMIRYFGPKIGDGVEREYEDILDEIPDDVKLRLGFKLLMTGTAGEGHPVTSLGNIWRQLDTTSKYLVMFQIVYSVAVMQEFGLVHNDMHPGNVLVATLPRPITMYYVYKRKIFRVITQYIPYLFDWDLGYSGLLGKNPKIDNSYYCHQLNICNRFSQKTDLYILFCNLGFQGPIAEVYGIEDNKITNIAENEIKVPLPTPNFANRFKRSHTPYIEPNIYKLSRGQMERAFGEEWTTRNMGKAVSITIKLEPTYLTLYQGFNCRPQSFSSSMPSPREFLDRQYFARLEVKSLAGASPNNIFRFPSRATETKESLAIPDKTPVYINPYIPSTKSKIAGRGRFPDMGDIQKTATFKQLKQAESKVLIPSDGEMRPQHRRTLFRWLKDLQSDMYFSDQVYFWSAIMTDLYIYQNRLGSADYQKVGISAFIIASEWGARNPITAERGAELTADMLSVDELQALVIRMKTFFKNKLLPTSLQFYRIFETYMDTRKRPDINNIVDYLVTESQNVSYPTQLASTMAIRAIQAVKPNAMNDKIRYMNSMRY